MEVNTDRNSTTSNSGPGTPQSTASMSEKEAMKQHINQLESEIQAMKQHLAEMDKESKKKKEM